MVFDFQGANPYLSDETRRMLELIMQQSQQPQLAQTEQSAKPVPQSEQASGTDIVNRAVESALPQRPSYLLPQAPNPLQNEYQQAILAQKMAYEAAQKKYEAAQDEAVRQGLLANMQEFNRQANSLRDIGASARMDLSGVGEGVALQDALKNLESQRAKDIAQMATGRYSMTTDQFWQSEYDRHKMAGVSDEGARRSANRAAREYKAKRVAYLNALYNSYGRNGLVTTELGNQILLNLAADSPTSANFYSQVYPNAKDAYARQNQLEDKAIDQSNLFDKMAQMFEYNMAQQLLGGEITRDNATHASDLAERRKIDEENRADKRTLDNFRSKIATTIQLASEYLPPEEVEQVKRGLFGLVSTKDKGDAKDSKGVAPDKIIQQLTGVYNALTQKRKALAQQDPDGTNAAIQEQIRATDDQASDIYDMIQGIIGIAGEAPKFTGDWEKDKFIVDTLRAEGYRRGLTWQQIKEAVYKQILSDTGNEEYARGAAGLN